MPKKVSTPLGKLGREYIRTVTTMLTSAFALVAALAWNDFIKNLISRYIKPGSTVISQLIYVILVTTILILVTMEMAKVSERIKEDDGPKDNLH